MARAPRDGRHDFDFLFGDWTVENRRLDPVTTGSFSGGTGSFLGNDTGEGTAMGCRFLWEHPAPGPARWTQAVRFAPGESWVSIWVMELTRVSG